MKAFNALRGRLKRPSASMIIATGGVVRRPGRRRVRHGGDPESASCPQHGRALGVDHPEHDRLRRGRPAVRPLRLVRGHGCRRPSRRSAPAAWGSRYRTTRRAGARPAGEGRVRQRGRLLRQPVQNLTAVGYRVFQTRRTRTISPQQPAEHHAGDRPERRHVELHLDGLGARPGPDGAAQQVEWFPKAPPPPASGTSPAPPARPRAATRRPCAPSRTRSRPWSPTTTVRTPRGQHLHGGDRQGSRQRLGRRGRRPPHQQHEVTTSRHTESTTRPPGLERGDCGAQPANCLAGCLAQPSQLHGREIGT